MIKTTPHPDWVNELLDYLEPIKESIVSHRIFTDIASCELSLRQFQGALINFYPLIESFPIYMALNLSKVPAGGGLLSRKTRYWLITNINQERLHTGWWKEFAYGFGVPKGALDKEIYPPPGMDAINNYLWRVCTHGSLAEGVSAANFAVEGPTGEWTKRVRDSIGKYQNVEGVRITEKTLEWVEAHARYDDKHPEEALEIIKAYSTTREERERVKRAAQRSLEYYTLALDTCYRLFALD